VGAGIDEKSNGKFWNCVLHISVCRQRRFRGGGMNQRDIWATAGILIERHGEQATIIAAQEADRFLEQGDMEQRRVWIRVMNAAASLIDVPSTKAN
jgi:hypothetical protein